MNFFFHFSNFCIKTKCLLLNVLIATYLVGYNFKKEAGEHFLDRSFNRAK